MTKKDFELIADTINHVCQSTYISHDNHERIAFAFMKKLRETNPRFDAAKFFDRAMGEN
jgi:hypothetical protein